jgi:hypothetical protein
VVLILPDEAHYFEHMPVSRKVSPCDLSPDGDQQRVGLESLHNIEKQSYHEYGGCISSQKLVLKVRSHHSLPFEFF